MDAGLKLYGPWKLIAMLLVMTVSVTGCVGSMHNGKTDIKAQDQEARGWDTSKLKPNHVALARDLMAKEFYDVALVQLKTAMEQGTTGPEVYNLAGVCTRETGKFKTSLDYFNRALELDKKHALVHNNLAILYAIMEKNTPARNHFMRAVALDPARAEFFNNLGYFLMNRKEYAGAEKRFNQALALEPLNENVINNLAICLGHQKKDDQALKLLMIHQPLDLAFYNMGCIYQLRNDPAKASAMFELGNRNSGKTKGKSQKAFDLQVMNPAAPIDSTPVEGMSGDVSHMIYSSKYIPAMKTDDGLESDDDE
jgi:Tfp pilus assembly protein PilF